MSRVSAAKVPPLCGPVREAKRVLNGTPNVHNFAPQPSPGQRLGGQRQSRVPDARVRLEDLVRGMLLEVAREAVEVVQLDVAALLAQLQAVQLRVLGRTHRKSLRITAT